MDENPLNTPELIAAHEKDFENRHDCFRDWSSNNPDATIRELAEYRERIAPTEDGPRKLFAKWCVWHLKQELRDR